MHYDDQLRASHLILSCVPSYTSYQDSSSALTVGSPLLSYLDIRLSRFWPNRITSGKARHSRRVRESSLEPLHDGLADTVFHGRVEHIPFEAPVPPELTEEMVQQCCMGLEH